MFDGDKSPNFSNAKKPLICYSGDNVKTKTTTKTFSCALLTAVKPLLSSFQLVSQ